MKSMSVFLCGIVLSSLSALADVQTSLSPRNGEASVPQAQSMNKIPDRTFTPPVPRGDLRNDILDNAQRRAGPTRTENQLHH